jgi:hypothetical protein
MVFHYGAFSSYYVYFTKSKTDQKSHIDQAIYRVYFLDIDMYRILEHFCIKYETSDDDLYSTAMSVTGQCSFL